MLIRQITTHQNRQGFSFLAAGAPPLPMVQRTATIIEFILDLTHIAFLAVRQRIHILSNILLFQITDQKTRTGFRPV